MKRPVLPVALTIAGSDSGGGAGIQADLKTFAALGVHGTSVVTCITAQNPRTVSRVQSVSAAMIAAQVDAVFAELRPHAAKTGMLFSGGIIRVVAERWTRQARRSPIPLIVDPVMAATSGAPLLKPSAIAALRQLLFPLATLITPNLDEVAILLGRRIATVDAMRAAARQLHQVYGAAALVKGGHLRGVKDAVDVFWDGKDELLLSSPFIRGVSTHGTGCTYAAAIAAGLARGLDLPEAVAAAKDFLTNAIATSRRVRTHTVLNTTGF